MAQPYQKVASLTCAGSVIDCHACIGCRGAPSRALHGGSRSAHDPHRSYGKVRTTFTLESAADFSIYPMPLASEATNFFTSAEELNVLGGVPLPENTMRDQMALTWAASFEVAF